MAKVRLTAPKVEAFTCPPGKDQAFLWDTESPGLAVRATAGGSRAFIFQSRFMGKPLRMTIGEASVWPLNNRMDRVGPGGRVLQAGAREEARRLQAIIDAGRDPREVKAASSAADLAAREAERRQAVLVREAWTAYLADRKPHWSARHYDDHVDLAHAGGEAWKRGSDKSRKTKPGPLAELLPEKLSSLDAERLEAWAAKEAKVRPSRARLALRLVKAFLGWCITQKGYRDAAHVEAAKSKRVGEKLGTPAKQNAVLQREQLQSWFTAVRAIPNPLISAYLQVMLLAGPRPNEPLWLKWQDVNFQWKTITIRDKVEGDREVGLTPYVEQLLAGLPRRNGWVFSSATSKSGRLTKPTNAHATACIAAGLPHVSLQGLRRSFASLCEWIEVPAGISAQVQGHAPQGVREQNYIRRPVDLLRSWQNKIEAWMLEQAGIVFAPKDHRLQYCREAEPHRHAS